MLLATALTLAANLPSLRAVFAGRFADPDDAMRLVEVRGLLAGQPWFDVSAPRLDPPFGASMHWSRLVDLPNAALIRLFAPFTADPQAWDRVVLPTLLLALLYAGMLRLAAAALGRTARAWPVLLPALIGTFLTGATIALVLPGRIGHHGPETVALVWAVALACGPARRPALAGALAGLLAALDLAMSLETLPFVAALGAALLLRWAASGAAARLRGFAVGLGLALPLLELATAAPAAWSAPSCDAVGRGHLAAALVFSAGAWFLAALPPGGARRRLVAAACLGAATVLALALAAPRCLGSPFAGVDPLVRLIWLDHVVESLPLGRFAEGRGALALALTVPLGLGALAGAAAAWSLSAWSLRRRDPSRAEPDRTRSDRVLALALPAALGALGLALSLWQVRVLATAAPFALVGGVAASDALRRRLPPRPAMRAAALAAVLPFTVTGWALVLPVDAPAASAGAAASTSPTAGGAGCLDPAALRPLGLLPPGRMVAPLDAGAHILEATAMSVFAAPYHRNDRGNRFGYDVFLARPDAAEALLRARGVRYVAVCPGLGETGRLAERAPQGLAARLLAGAPPSYLAPLPLASTPYRVYAVEPQP